MTEKYFFDTDCLSAFLWVREESILAKLYAGRIILPAQVYYELQRVPHLLAKVDTLKNSSALNIESMEVGIITEVEGNNIWSEMIRRRRMLPTTTFSDYIANYCTVSKRIGVAKGKLKSPEDLDQYNDETAAMFGGAL